MVIDEFLALIPAPQFLISVRVRVIDGELFLECTDEGLA
jgi:hypothetical protein